MNGSFDSQESFAVYLKYNGEYFDRCNGQIEIPQEDKSLAY